MHLIQLPAVYNDNCGSHNDVHWSNNDVRTSTKLFSPNLCLIWLGIFKGCFLDLGNGFQLTIKTNQRLNWIIISNHYVPTMYIFMIYALIFITGTPPLQFLENLALKSVHVWEATIKNGHVTMTADAISNYGRCRENAYFYH